MSLLDMLKGLVDKKVKLQVYSLSISVTDVDFLHVTAAYSLEEAFVKTKAEFHKCFPKMSMLGEIRLQRFYCVEPDILFKGYTSVEGIVKEDVKAEKDGTILAVNTVDLRKDVNGEVKIVEPIKMPEDKNILMKDIINKKDNKMLEENKEKFSDAEYQYLVNRINNVNKK